MSNRVTESVTQHEIDTFQRDGAIKLSAAFDSHWLEQLAHGIEKNFQQPGPNAKRYTPEDGPGGFYGDYCNWQRIGEYRDFVLNSPAAALLADLLQTTTLRFYHEHVLVKEPGTREVTPWHHDLPVLRPGRPASMQYLVAAGPGAAQRLPGICRRLAPLG